MELILRFRARFDLRIKHISVNSQSVAFLWKLTAAAGGSGDEPSPRERLMLQLEKQLGVSLF